MIVNRVKQNYREGKPSFGAFITFQSPAVVEVAALAGFDYVRIDAYKFHLNPESLDNMIRAAYAYNVTPWVRCRNDPWEIGLALDNGALIVSTRVGTVEEAQAAVAAVRYPPKGARDSSRPRRFQGMPAPEYSKWAAEEVLLSLQLETPKAFKNYREIVKVEGVDIIQFGKNGIAAALGVPAELSGYQKEVDPRVLEAEREIVSAILEAGKQAGLVHSITEDGIERTKRWIEQGVLVMCVDHDYAILSRAYKGALANLRGA